MINSIGSAVIKASDKIKKNSITYIIFQWCKSKVPVKKHLQHKRVLHHPPATILKLMRKKMGVEAALRRDTTDSSESIGSTGLSDKENIEVGHQKDVLLEVIFSMIDLTRQ